ncbi:hypothetical protein F4802DRAFT_474256 [Xylaria palmicola]|nr:hypothetical protein F4802DRAFT_474256 [Xylaria palmicola]
MASNFNDYYIDGEDNCTSQHGHGQRSSQIGDDNVTFQYGGYNEANTTGEGNGTYQDGTENESRTSYRGNFIGQRGDRNRNNTNGEYNDVFQYGNENVHETESVNLSITEVIGNAITTIVRQSGEVLSAGYHGIHLGFLEFKRSAKRIMNRNVR